MAITVREALKSGPLEGARVIAGAAGLDRVIRYVDVMEVPDAEAWLRSDLLIVTSWYAIRDDESAQCRLVEAMARAGVAGLALKVERFLGRISARVIETADRCGLPIIEVPGSIPYVDITHPMLTTILHEQASRLEHSLKVHELFTRVALEGGGFEAIARTLSSLVENPAGICNPAGEVLAWSDGGLSRGLQLKAGDSALSAEDLGCCAFMEKGERRHLRSSVDGRTFVAFPIRVGSRTCGYLLVSEAGRPFQDGDSIALEHAGTVTALEMAKQAAVSEVEHRIRKDFVDDLLWGSLPSEEVALARAAALGWKFAPPVVAVVVDIDEFGALVEDRRDEQFAQGVKRDMLAITRTVLAEQGADSFVVGRSDSIVAFVNVPADREKFACRLEAIVQSLKQRLEAQLRDISVSLGVSRPCGQIGDLRARYEEACEVLKIGRMVFGRGSVGTHERLDVHRLFYHYEPKENLGEFCKDLLGPLEEYDAENGTELVRTLRVYLERGGAMKETAAALYVHRNTLRYRLRRIEQMTGCRLDNSPDRFRLALALCMRPFLPPH